MKLLYLLLAVGALSIMLNGPTLETDKVLTIQVPDKEPPVAKKPDWFWYLKVEIERREGVKRLPYLDGDVPAVGMGVRISEEEAERIRQQGGLSDDEIITYTVLKHHRIRKQIAPALEGLSEPQQLAVIDMAYSCGVRGLKQKKLWKYILAKDTGPEAVALWLKTAATHPGNARARKVQVALWRVTDYPEAMADLNTLTAQNLECIRWRADNGYPTLSESW